MTIFFQLILLLGQVVAVGGGSCHRFAYLGCFLGYPAVLDPCLFYGNPPPLPPCTCLTGGRQAFHWPFASRRRALSVRFLSSGNDPDEWIWSGDLKLDTLGEVRAM